MTQSDNSCSMQHCLNTFDTVSEEKMFFNFPTDLDLCMKWIQNCGRQDFLEILSYGGALPFILKYVCQDHFCEEDFLEKDDFSKGLRNGACPRPLIKCESIELPEKLQPYFGHQKEDQHNTSLPDAAPQIEIKQEEIVIKMNSEDLRDDPSEILRANLKTNPNCIPRVDPVWKKRGKSRSKRAIQMARKRQKETPEQRARRLERDRLRNKVRREQEKQLSLTDPEVAESLRIKRMRETLLVAIKRQNESPEEKALRRERERLRVREKRQKERVLSKSDPDLAAKLELQKLRFRVMVAVKRQQETPEQKDIRRERNRNRIREKRMKEKELSREDAHLEEQLRIKTLKERVVKALKRQTETPAERAKRLERQKLNKREERSKKQFDSESKRKSLEIETREFSISHSGSVPVNMKNKPEDTDFYRNILPRVPTAEIENNNKTIKTQITTEELVLLQNKLSEVLKSRKKKNNTNDNGNKDLLDDYEDSSDDESSNDSDDSEYDRCLDSVNSDDSRDTVSLEPECVIDS